MRKIISLFMLFVLSLTLLACDQKKKMSNEAIREQIQVLLDSRSYEVTLQGRIVTEEMEIKMNPLMTFSTYTNENDQSLLKIFYFNKLMEGMGLGAFELIYDEHNEIFYIHDTFNWYKSSTTELGNFFNVDEQDLEENEDMEFITNKLLDFYTKFNQAKFIENEEEELVHYELEYNLFDLLKEIFDYFNDKNDLGYDDLTSFLKEYELDDFIDLFKTFVVDVYFDPQNDNQLKRIEFDFMNILANPIITDKIQEYLDELNIEYEVNVSKMLEYVEHLEIGIQINQLNSLDPIEIPNEAKNAYDIKYINAPFDPKDLYEVNVGTPFTVSLEETDEAKWLTFTIEQNKQITIQNGSNVYTSLYDEMFMMVYDDEHNGINDKTYILNEGTYYVRVSANYQKGDYVIIIR